MKVINNLTEYYSFTDNNDHLYIHSLDEGITKLLRTSERSEAFPVLIEHDVLFNTFYHENKFEFWDATHRYKLEYLGFSSYQELINAIITYLNSRISSTSSILLKAKYNHILWQSSLTDRFQYGKKAIDNYLAYLSNWRLKEYNEDLAIHILDYFKYLQKLCASLNYRTADYHLLLKEVINNANAFPSWFIFYIIKLQFDSRKSYDVEFNTKCFHYLETIFDENLSSIFEDAYDLAIKYGQYLKLPILNCHNLIAEYYYQSALKRNPDKHDFLIPQFYAQAIHYFKLGKNIEMLNKLNKDFIKIKLKHELPVVQFEQNLSADFSSKMSYFKNAVQNHIHSLDTNGVLAFLSHNKDLIPNNITLKESKRNNLLNFASTYSYDINNNFKQSTSKLFINPDTFYLQLITTRCLLFTFKNCIETGKLNNEIFIDYLQKSTWLGTTTEGKCWLELLNPGIASFFSVYKRYLSEPTLGNSEFILPIDSLATKMEGILRTFAQLNNINTTKIEDDKKGKSEIQTREIYLTELLSDGYPQFEKLFDANEYKFFKTIYLKEGYDIRNNIAHSFYKPDDYTIKKLLLIMLSIIRISKYPAP